jgi:hypothetical protein
MEATKPKVVTALNGKPVVAVRAGGMHSLCLTKDGVVFSFGCNDDGALGRLTEEEDDNFAPGILLFLIFFYFHKITALLASLPPLKQNFVIRVPLKKSL